MEVKKKKRKQSDKKNTLQIKYCTLQKTLTKMLNKTGLIDKQKYSKSQHEKSKQEHLEIQYL